MRSAIVDSNYLVALFDELDSLHGQSLDVCDGLEEVGLPVIFLDILMGEVISVLARRCAERKRSKQLTAILRKLELRIPHSAITWVGQEVRRYYADILSDVYATNGRRNFNDALVVLLARGLGIEAIVSFDPDFDGVPGLTRLATAAAVRNWSGV